MHFNLTLKKYFYGVLCIIMLFTNCLVYFYENKTYKTSKIFYFTKQK